MAEAAVMLVGACGLGKSTLGNFLLYGTPDDGFGAAAGRNPVTTACEVREARSPSGSPFKVVDTPAAPNTGEGTEAYKKIILEAARLAERLNALTLVIEYSQNRNYRTSDMENAVGLLRELNTLGCAIFIACRVPGHLPGRSEERTREDQQTWEEFVTDIKRRAGVDDVTTYLLDAAHMAAQARDMRSTIIDCPSVKMPGGGNMNGYNHLKINTC